MNVGFVRTLDSDSLDKTGMGQQKEVKIQSKAMEDPMKLKEEGNEAFKAGNYDEFAHCNSSIFFVDWS